MMAKTLLNVTSDTMLYAKTHGAKYNATSREWRWAQLTESALRECSGKQANRWLNTSKIALKGRTPLEAMTTSEGCDAVEALLQQLNE